MAEVWSLTCECGHRTTLEHGGNAGEIVAVSCARCGAPIWGRLPADTRQRRRALPEKTLTLRAALVDALIEYEPPMTIRQLFYVLETRGFVPKDMKGYRQIQYQVLNMRRDNTIPYGWIADYTRWRRKPNTYDGLDAFGDFWQRAYRRDLWTRQPIHLEIWVEKDSIAGVIARITEQYDVSLMVQRGFASDSFLYATAEHIKEIGKPAYIYQFGDHDPSGERAGRIVEKTLRQHGANVVFTRVALTLEQIELYNLSTRPVKRTDPHKRGWGAKPCADLEAMPPNVLRRLVEECITRHITNEREWQFVLEQEQRERESIAALFGTSANQGGAPVLQ